MDRKTLIALMAIGLVGILIRIFPTIRNFALGNDFGIYYTILQDFVRSGKVVGTFSSPWGGAGYGDFPMMYWIIIGIWKTTGINYTELLIRVPPIFGGLSSVIIFFIALKITGNKLVSLLSSLFDAVNPILVFQTSLSSILVFGHFFGLITILFFIYYLENRRYLFPALISGAALIASHPLSTFMYLMAIVGISMIYLMIKSKRSDRLSLAIFLYPISSMTFLYWYLFFPDFKSFLASGILHLSAPAIIFLYFVMVTVVLVFPYSIIRPTLARYGSFPERSIKSILPVTLVSYASVSAIGLLLLVRVLPAFTVADALSLIPILMDGFLAIMGLFFVHGKAKSVILGWLLLLLIPFLYSLATWNMVLYPGRYFEYFFEPLSILEAIAIVHILKSTQISVEERLRRGNKTFIARSKGMVHNGKLDLTHYMRVVAKKIEMEFERIRISNFKSFAVLCLLVIVVTASAATPYQVEKAVTPSGNQSINIPDQRAALWLEHNGSSNESMATDHILGLLLDGYNVSSTFENISYLWNSTSITNNTLEELMGNNFSISMNYSHVGYILIDNYMLYDGVWGFNGLTHPYAKPIMMTNASFLKFFTAPFVPVYFNYTSSSSWAMVLQVNWTYLDSNFNLNVTSVPVMTNGNLTASYILKVIKPL